VYADDIVSIVPTIDALQKLLTLLENQLDGIDMCINATKSSCILSGRRYEAECKNITVRNGDKLADGLSLVGILVSISSAAVYVNVLLKMLSVSFIVPSMPFLVRLADRPQKKSL